MQKIKAPGVNVRPNGLVGFIPTLAIVLLFWLILDRAWSSVGRLWRPARA